MRHLIVCCDGTWNTLKQENVTNVARLYNALDTTDSRGHDQLRYHQQGAGTTGGLVNRLLGGGVAGTGLAADVLAAYHWLATTYKWGDRIALFGFSRGAYTARSLAGMIACCGLLDPTHSSDERQLWRQIEQLYHRRYRAGERADPGWRQGLAFRFDPGNAKRIPVHFIGVWDTVGTLGVPDHPGLLNLVDPPHRHSFHDLRLNPHVTHARHAVAMDETRGSFVPALWKHAPEQDVKQVWFPGSHQDVGGGHPETGLSDGALEWMIDEAQTAVGLAFAKSPLGQIRPDAADVLHEDSRHRYGVFDTALDPVIGPLLDNVFPPRPRAVPRINPQDRNPVLHESVYDRYDAVPITSGPYRPTQVLTEGQSATVSVQADTPWNDTGIYLEPGAYRFRAQGSWLGSGVPSGPAGTPGLRRFVPTEGGRLIGTVLGHGERLLRRLTGNRMVGNRMVGNRMVGNRMANALFFRREAQVPWMSLVGVVANDAVAVPDGPNDHERIYIGAGTDHFVTAGGYLYAFANDAWGFYGDNRGSMRLMVTRTA